MQQIQDAAATLEENVTFKIRKFQMLNLFAFFNATSGSTVGKRRRDSCRELRAHLIQDVTEIALPFLSLLHKLDK